MNEGWWTFTPVILCFAVIPILELFFPEDDYNFSMEEEASVLNNKWYDRLIYLILPIQYGGLIFFLYRSRSII